MPRGGLRKHDIVIVVSHDCDVVNRDLAKEPWVELCVGREVPQLSGSHTYGKNPRELQLVHESDGVQRTYSVSMHERVLRPRRQLLKFREQGRLDAENIHVLASWLARRYDRAAFPDNFVSRYEPVRRKIERELKASGQLLSAVYLSTSDLELPATTPYSIGVYGTMRSSAYDDRAKRAKAIALIATVAALFDNCEGITVEDDEVISEAHLTIDDLRDLRPFETDYLSFQMRAPGRLPAHR